MAQVYILRRDGRDYQAPDLETLRRWAQDGRVLPTDMVYSPVYQSWYRAHDLRGLRDVLPRVDTPQPAATSATQQFWLRKGDKNYPADSLETVLSWASAGNINSDDLIFHPAYGKWFRAGDSPQLVSRFPMHKREATEQARVAQPLGATAEMVARNFGTEVKGGKAGGPSEPADSMTATVMDFRVVSPKGREAQAAATSPLVTADKLAVPPGGPQAAKALSEPAPIGPEDTEAPESAPSGAPGVGSPTPKREGPSVSRPEEAAPVAEAEQVDEAPSAELPSTVAPTTEAPTTEAPATEAPSLDGEASAPPPPEDPPPEDVEAAAPDKYVDRLGLMKPFYHLARAFVLTRDMRPGETLEGSCVLPGTDEDFKGWPKARIYGALASYLEKYMGGRMSESASEHEAAERPAYDELVARGRVLLEAFQRAERCIGTEVPERVVIGNSNRPKMSPDENAAMLGIDQHLKRVISLKARVTAAA